MRDLELLAPARNADIGIAAIDCGADAVYIAGPAFGARQAAGNSMEDVRRLCEYAHRFGARIFLTLNTILYDSEPEEAERLKADAAAAGVDALIVQDLAVLSRRDIPLHASTQCAIRTPDKARFYESLGFSRLVLERELSLEQIRAIRETMQCELEFFVHGALCVCYSGQCYLSEAIAGRSANRGACIQACRSLYDLADTSGRVLVKDKALLSLKDYNLLSRVGDLAAAGIDSFKIEGRLKNLSYVRNVVRAYSMALDTLVSRHPDSYRRASFGRVAGGFTPDLNKTFNRGYTELYLDGKRQGGWSSMDAPTSIGEYVGTVASFRDASTSADRIRIALRGDGKAHGQNDMVVTIQPGAGNLPLKNGDGFSFVAGNEIVGFRGDVCEGNRIRCRHIPELFIGARLFRNVSSAFEKELDSNLPVRLLGVAVDITVTDPGLSVRAESEDGRTVSFERPSGAETANNPDRMRSLFETQIGKGTGIYSFTLRSLEVLTQDGGLPFLPASVLNGIRRDLADALDALPCVTRPLRGPVSAATAVHPAEVSYLENVANERARAVYRSLGAEKVEDAFEISHRQDAELMRTKYCIRYELGFCPVHQRPPRSGPFAGLDPAEPLFLLNNGQRYALRFDCRHCEMTVSDA